MKNTGNIFRREIKEVKQFFRDRKEKICDMNDFATGTGRNMRSYIKTLVILEITGILFFASAVISGTGMVRSLLLLVLWGAGGMVIPYFLLKKKCDRKRTDIEIELPEYMDRAAFLLNSGMQLGEALKNAAEGSRGVFSMEVYKALERISVSENVEDEPLLVLERLAMKCNTASVNSFVSLVVQNIRKGSDTLSSMLRVQADITRSKRRNTVRKMGEEAGTYMLFPSIMIFGAIMIMMTAPVIMMLGQG